MVGGLSTGHKAYPQRPQLEVMRIDSKYYLGNSAGYGTYYKSRHALAHDHHRVRKSKGKALFVYFLATCKP